MSVLTFQKSLDPPYFISLGDVGREGVEWFCYAGERTEYLASNLISLDVAMAALKHFVDFRTKPECVEWEQL